MQYKRIICKNFLFPKSENIFKALAQTSFFCRNGGLLICFQGEYKGSLKKYENEDRNFFFRNESAVLVEEKRVNNVIPSTSAVKAFSFDDSTKAEKFMY